MVTRNLAAATRAMGVQYEHIKLTYYVYGIVLETGECKAFREWLRCDPKEVN